MKNKREIKFRVWNLDRKEWADFGYLDMNGNFIQEGLEYHNYNYKVMQYTGLKDANGKEIYEGDIIRVNGRNMEVFFKDGYFGWGQEHDGKYSFDPFDGEEVEVIGNIHENPELLSKLSSNIYE